jgi:autotransporter family porin
LNIVGVDPAALGFINAWPCDKPEPNSSVLNLWNGAVRANQILVALSDSGEVCLSAMLVDSSRVHVVMDVVGYTGGVGDPVPPEEPPPVDPPSGNPPSSGRFETLAAGSALPSGAECASRVRPAAEVRSVNAAQNQVRGVIPGAGTDWLDFQGNWAPFDRVDGDFVGTTDEILQWAACKWGIDEDVVRAQIVTESYWKMSANGDGGDSFGLGQVRVPYHGHRPGAGDDGAFQNDNAIRSSAYNVDYTYAVWRGCFEGQYNWLGNTRGDLWGCAGSWFSGQFRDAQGLKYVGVVQGHLNDRTWETASFING